MLYRFIHTKEMKLLTVSDQELLRIFSESFTIIDLKNYIIILGEAHDSISSSCPFIKLIFAHVFEGNHSISDACVQRPCLLIRT